MSNHILFMQQALTLAAMGRITVSPNPMVGCIIVKEQQIIAEAYHQRCGESHAEVLALQQAGEQAKDSVLYVTLEPCCHFGKTPPCTKAIIGAGIKKVIVASIDPNPLMAGKGIQTLRNAGIQVEYGILENEAKKLNEIFFHYIQTKRPFVIAKWAMSLDGNTTTHPQDSRHITSTETQQSTHLLRQQVDAILIGANTARHDNPQLTNRLQNAVRQPLRIIVSSQGNLPEDLLLFSKSLPGKTLIASTININNEKKKFFNQNNIEVLMLPAQAANQVDLVALLEELGKRQISSLLIEGGMQIHKSFLRNNLVNRVHAYLAPVIIGDLPNKHYLPNLQFKQIHSDFEFVGDIQHV